MIALEWVLQRRARARPSPTASSSRPAPRRARRAPLAFRRRVQQRRAERLHSRQRRRSRGAAAPNRSSIVRSSEKWLYCSWLVVPPLTKGESSSAPTWPPPFGPAKPGGVAVRELRLAAARARVGECAGRGRLVDGDHEQAAVLVGRRGQDLRHDLLQEAVGGRPVRPGRPASRRRDCRRGRGRGRCRRSSGVCAADREVGLERG